MNKTITVGLLASVSLCGAADVPGAAAAPGAPPSTQQARILFIHEGDVNAIHCRVLMDCLIEAPKGEQFTRVTLGDPERWRDTKESFPSRFYSVKPAYDGMTTTLHLYTDHDNEYGFTLDEAKNAEPDYTTILKTDDSAIAARIAGPSTVVSRAEFEAMQKRADTAVAALEAAKRDAAAAKAEGEKQVTAAVSQVSKNLPAQIRSYTFDKEEAKKRPWGITEIFADNQFTYIKRQVRGADLPNVVAVGANGKPEIVVPHYDPDRDLWVVPQRLDDGYLTFGGDKKEKRLKFHLPVGA